MGASGGGKGAEGATAWGVWFPGGVLGSKAPLPLAVPPPEGGLGRTFFSKLVWVFLFPLESLARPWGEAPKISGFT